MNKSHLVDHVASSLGVTRSDATVYVECVLEGVTKGLIEDGRVKITGFGAFSRRHREPRRGTNPLTGEPIRIPASVTCGFKASPALRDRLQPEGSASGSTGDDGRNQKAGAAAAGQIEHKQASGVRTPGR